MSVDGIFLIILFSTEIYLVYLNLPKDIFILKYLFVDYCNLICCSIHLGHHSKVISIDISTH